ncbi:hypothetical protein [Lysobacter gummosus]|uniref:hypothetical protein n=1 Tax=Lysobacter gummosus TaxID=262324 RepID=UPI003632BBCA
MSAICPQLRAKVAAMFTALRPHAPRPTRIHRHDRRRCIRAGLARMRRRSPSRHLRAPPPCTD